jgi:ADP-ribose pyrophosphatase
MKPKRLARTEIYTSDWLSLYADRVVQPGGRIIEKWHIIKFHKGGSIALVENDKVELLLVQSYRYATDSVDWELPAGGVESGDDPIETAKREVLEETGWETTDHELLYTYYPIISVSDTLFYIVRCKATLDTGAFDTNEVKAVKWFPIAELRQMILDQKIKDGYSLSALLLYFMNYGS